MDFAAAVERLRAQEPAGFPAHANTLDFARSLDGQDALKHLRDSFIFPTKASLTKKALNGRLPGEAEASGATALSATSTSAAAAEPAGPDGAAGGSGQRSIYFCGNSLGLQPKTMRRYIDAQLETWASVGVYGHFAAPANSPLAPWQDMAEQCARQSADMVGARPGEVVVMNGLSANIHFLMASFYRPTEKRHKILLEWKPFPSDWYAIESQIRWHGFDPATSMVEIQPDADFYIATDAVLAALDEHADEAALLLLPGLQYYSGQLFDMQRITAHARARGVVVGWDLAHCAGNVELRLHDWDVDFAMWCTYKYINAGPGAIAGAFVHERHGAVERDAAAADADAHGSAFRFRPRLAGWYGGDKSVRFAMAKTFQPTPGASGFQVSNPSALDLAALSAALAVFNTTTMAALRSKSLLLTAYAEHLLDQLLAAAAAGEAAGQDAEPLFRIITPRAPAERGAQLSLLLRNGILDKLSGALKDAGVVCDQRKPDVLRLAPVPMYNTFEEVWACVDILRRALQ